MNWTYETILTTAAECGPTAFKERYPRGYSTAARWGLVKRIHQQKRWTTGELLKASAKVMLEKDKNNNDNQDL